MKSPPKVGPSKIGKTYGGFIMKLKDEDIKKGKLFAFETTCIMVYMVF